MSRTQLIRRLLVNAHLNIAERQQLGRLEVEFDELREAARERLIHHRFLPPVTDGWDRSRLISEGVVMEQRTGDWVLHEQVAGAFMNLLSDKETVYTNFDHALEVYLEKINWNIDGIIIKPRQ